jgi:choline-sulfatase
MDIAPTVCDVAGLPIPDQFQGVSLIPIASTEETSRSRRIFTEVTYSQPFAIPPSVATYSKDSVYIHFPRSERGDELYDVQNDSGQHNNLADTRAADALVEAIESHLAESDYFSRPRYDKEPLDDKLADHLRALGYLK